VNAKRFFFSVSGAGAPVAAGVPVAASAAISATGEVAVRRERNIFASSS